MQQYHFWVGNKSGLEWALSKDYKLYPAKGERFKYLGYTYYCGWPKTLNTGRVLYKPQGEKGWKKHNKKHKLLIRNRGKKEAV